MEWHCDGRPPIVEMPFHALLLVRAFIFIWAVLRNVMYNICDALRQFHSLLVKQPGGWYLVVVPM